MIDQILRWFKIHFAYLIIYLIGIPDKHAFMGYQFVEDDAYGEDIRTMINVFPPCLLRRHVGDLSLDQIRLSYRALVRRLGNAEINDFHLAVICYENVLRTYIPVYEV